MTLQQQPVLDHPPFPAPQSLANRPLSLQLQLYRVQLHLASAHARDPMRQPPSPLPPSLAVCSALTGLAARARQGPRASQILRGRETPALAAQLPRGQGSRSRSPKPWAHRRLFVVSEALALSVGWLVTPAPHAAQMAPRCHVEAEPTRRSRRPLPTPPPPAAPCLLGVAGPGGRLHDHRWNQRNLPQRIRLSGQHALGPSVMAQSAGSRRVSVTKRVNRLVHATRSRHFDLTWGPPPWNVPSNARFLGVAQPLL